MARAHAELILKLAMGAIWIHRDRSVAWLVEIIPSMAADDRAGEPVFFAPGVSFSFPLALIAGNRESLEGALRRDIELARAVAAGEVLVDRGDAAPLVGFARKLVAARTAWKLGERGPNTASAPHASSSAKDADATAPAASDGDAAPATAAPTASTKLDALLERSRMLERSVRRARVVLASEPNALLESVCSQAARALSNVRAQIEAELAVAR